MVALITAALEGLAAIKFFWLEIKDLQLKSTLDTIVSNQEKIMAGHLALAQSNTLEEMRAALHKIHDAH